MKKLRGSVFSKPSTKMVVFALFIWILLTGHAIAANFDIKPIRLFIDAQTPIEKLTLKNRSDDDVTLQIKAYKWTQGEQGEDIYEDTNDVITFPKIFTLKKEQERIVRVGTNLSPGLVEKTYRIYVQEVPSGVTESKGANVHVLMKVGVPLFIRPTKKEDSMDIESISMKNGKAQIKVRNKGNSHFIVTTVNIKGMDNKEKEIFSTELGGWYILSGRTKVYEVSIPVDKCSNIAKTEVAIKTNVNGLGRTGDLNVDRVMCRQGR